ncbi:nucleotide-binding universal stress UspA family protein [Archangium gephyra]|uniref:Nucleotide-binding universal stress UspA family protein n=1 Tax=Archangium gephyra TaxID=48 RepID=A0AAC8QIT3_9BACT|nr:universal stress protein [Archangium gephyra]AKJ08348.1 Universal stress protein UspA [Archangium gephyra]REG14268.1 nucleotide-binding universal stress UspA family protein [Archangium gephyra]
MRRILVAVDSTEVAREAARVALELGGRVGAQVMLVHVLPASVAEGETADFAAFERACEDYARGLLEELRQHTGHSGPPPHTAVLHGEPAGAICKAAEAEEVDLVIVGTRTRGAIARTLLGSLADELLRSCPKPVMVVPETGRKARVRHEDAKPEASPALALPKPSGAPG